MQIRKLRPEAIVPRYMTEHAAGLDLCAAIDAPQFQLRTEVERADSILKHLERNARIDQRGKEHISADSGEAIEIRNLHFADSLIFIPLIAISDSGRSAFIEPDRYPSRSSVTYL